MNSTPCCDQKTKHARSWGSCPLLWQKKKKKRFKKPVAKLSRASMHD